MLLPVGLRRDDPVITVLIFQIGVRIMGQVDGKVLKRSLDGGIIYLFGHNMSEIVADIRGDGPQSRVLLAPHEAVKQVAPLLIGAEGEQEAHCAPQAIVELSGGGLAEELLLLRAAVV